MNQKTNGHRLVQAGLSEAELRQLFAMRAEAFLRVERSGGETPIRQALNPLLETINALAGYRDTVVAECNKPSN